MLKGCNLVASIVHHLHIMTIVHGFSEFLLSQHIKSNLRLKHEIIARNKGHSSIQINGLMSLLDTDKRFKTFNAFYRQYPDIKKQKKELIDFKLFPIMDVDDCDEKKKQEYIENKLFAKHWLAPYIVPIYNDPNLEYVMHRAGIPVERKEEYVRIFPTNHGDANLETIKDFSKRLKSCDGTNMEIYADYCLKVAEKYLIKD